MHYTIIPVKINIIKINRGGGGRYGSAERVCFLKILKTEYEAQPT